MRNRALVCVWLAAAACGKKAEEKKVQPEPKVVEQAAKKPALMRVPLTSMSPEALAEYEKARDLAQHSRGLEAIEHYKKAIELDPTFARAHADLGAILPGSDGTDYLAKAGPLAARLPEAERLYVEAAQASRAGDDAKMLAALTKMVELAPGEWEAQLQLAQIQADRGQSDAAIQGAQKVLAAKPDAAIAYNLIAYAHAAKKEWEPAIAAAKKQVELMPNEPNPLDTLGEIQLQAGKLADAEVSFVAATKADPKFLVSWGGAALARAYQANYKGAYEAFAEEKTSPGLYLAHEAMLDTAWIQFAEGKTKAALASLDALDKVADIKKTPIYADVAIARGMILTETGKYADAAKASGDTMKRAEELAGDGKPRVVRFARLNLLRAAALAGKPAADADALVAAIEEAAKAHPPSAYQDSVVAYARGLAIWAKGDAREGIAKMILCDPQLVLCRVDLAALQRKTGDMTAAAATSHSIRENPLRDAGVVYYWVRAK